MLIVHPCISKYVAVVVLVAFRIHAYCVAGTPLEARKQSLAHIVTFLRESPPTFLPGGPCT